MKYGFIIDNRKCIGCHACTVACKSEHDVAVGVNRTWVKQVEKGTFPDTRRVFSVMRCNHCTDAPCVEICPVEALYIRKDGIVDFDNRRCIGCKSCMQACPYDALYIDPKTNTAAKCNYCAHRVDVGLEPACVNVCPEHAIISGDMDDPESEIAQLLGTHHTTVRREDKGTKPNVYYINGDSDSLNPEATDKSDQYLWSSQSRGVGHYARYADAKLDNGKSLVDMADELAGKTNLDTGAKSSVQVLMEKSRRVYDVPDKGILWGWEVPAYVWTKAISAGSFLMPVMASAMGVAVSDMTWWIAMGISMLFLLLTTAFLVKDLDQPGRFIYVLLRPQWKSWLVRGGYALTGFGGVVAMWMGAKFLEMDMVVNILQYVGAAFALVMAVYTAFLFAQAKGRDFWQSPALAFHMLGHSLLAGAAALAIVGALTNAPQDWMNFLSMVMLVSLIFNGLIVLFELTTTHPTQAAKSAVNMILHGRYKTKFWTLTVLVGLGIPLALVLVGGSNMMLLIAGVMALYGMLVTEQIWIEAPQRIPLS